MAISKRVRYEVLRRDGFTCRYCHAKNKPLEVDHVIPVSLGGKDTPDNLVASCHDCNIGKTSTKPDDELVADIKKSIISKREAIRQALAELSEEVDSEDSNEDSFVASAVDGFTAITDREAPDWAFASVRSWYRQGVDAVLLGQAYDIAANKFMRTYTTGDHVFKYVAGIIRNWISEAEEKAGANEHGA